MIIKKEQSAFEALNESTGWLERAAADKHHKMRQFSFSTVETQLNLPSSRMVILRQILPKLRARFYTDRRSRKVQEIQINPKASLLFWDPSKNLQIRLAAECTIHHGNETANEEWNRVQGSARKDYNTVLAPGSPIENPEDAEEWHDPFSEKEFTVIDALPFRIDLLQIRRKGHLALRFQRENPEDEWEGGWIVP
ncbi:MAG: pyridoxamine 5'-phosphate oxidase family protein [Balneolaceae bacterium]|nr:pyridoxamine 5'-phosphate oxidase family protein [Balneolaceae bacterium]MCH8549969.1 pyridoxamine 5'-phosphate oxidase family protein [Balneolaceae bacterium]